MGWRQQILADIDNRVTRYYVAADPDGLLGESDIQAELAGRGFDVHFFEDSIELRFYLEQLSATYGSRGCVISINSDIDDPDELPFDILSQAKRLSLSLSDCFPDIHVGVLKALQPDHLGILDAAIEDYPPGKLGEATSCDFILRHVFKIAPELIQSPADLLRSLLALHYPNTELPQPLVTRLVGLLAKRKEFTQWPVGTIVSSKQAFLSFLQSHWPSYVERVALSSAGEVREDSAQYGQQASAVEQIELPFGHDDVRVYVDNLFVEGYLVPIEVHAPDRVANHWCRVGVVTDPEGDLERRYTRLLQLCEDTLPDEQSKYQDWQQYAYRWAELVMLQHLHQALADDAAFSLAQAKTDQVFSAWLLEKYGSLHNHPPVPPVMLHHIPRAMARHIDASPASKSALILIDGLAIDQWLTVYKHLQLSDGVTQSAVYAWVPTLTSISRQALFAAKPPYQFANTIGTTSAEPKEWRQFWADQGLSANEVFYAKSLGTDDVDALIDRLSDRRLRAVGLVINTVDDMMHGMQLGAAGMHNQVELWAQKGYLQQVIDALVDKGFSIHITSDHGNVEAVGAGKVNEGAVAWSRGERARIYATATLRDSVSFDATQAIAWPAVGLPSDCLPVVMRGRKAFVTEGKTVVSHGGVALEEVMVPYITINRDLDE